MTYAQFGALFFAVVHNTYKDKATYFVAFFFYIAAFVEHVLKYHLSKANNGGNQSAY